MSECSNCFCWRPWIYKILCLFTGSFGAAEARMLLFIVSTESVFAESDFLAFMKAPQSSHLLTHLRRHGEMSSWLLCVQESKKKFRRWQKSDVIYSRKRRAVALFAEQGWKITCLVIYSAARAHEPAPQTYNMCESTWPGVLYNTASASEWLALIF